MTTEELLEITLELAAERGLGAVSMSLIAERAKLKKSSLYSHFTSKNEMIELMYRHFRSKAAQQISPVVDYGSFVEGKTLAEILSEAVSNYRSINSQPTLQKFYRLIMSERAHNPAAAQIMAEETVKMIAATKALFYAIKAKGISDFADPDGAALIFAMGVHSVLDFECDARAAESAGADGAMDMYLREFCAVYGKKE